MLKLFYIPSFGIIPFALCLYDANESVLEFDENKCVGLFPRACYALNFSSIEFRRYPVNYEDFIYA